MPKIPRWKALYDELRGGIEDGTYPVGTTLPSMSTLVIPTVRSDSTVKRAFAELIQEGMVRAEHGSGHWVIRAAPLNPTEQRLAKLEREMAEVRKKLNLDSSGDRP